MQKWEYTTLPKIATKDLLVELNKLGELGWELITAPPGSTPPEYSCYVLKRPLRD